MIVYILYSKKLNSYYVGVTQDIEKRLYQHNSGYSKYTKKGIPWQIVTTFSCSTRSEAVRLEKKIVHKKKAEQTCSAKSKHII